MHHDVIRRWPAHASAVSAQLFAVKTLTLAIAVQIRAACSPTPSSNIKVQRHFNFSRRISRLEVPRDDLLQELDGSDLSKCEMAPAKELHCYNNVGEQRTQFVDIRGPGLSFQSKEAEGLGCTLTQDGQELAVEARQRGRVILLQVHTVLAGGSRTGPGTFHQRSVRLCLRNKVNR